MGKKYLLGVDGGNTKTLYFLHDTDGNFVDYMAAGTCSHEALADSYTGTRREMQARLEELFGRNHVRVEDVAFAVFGLAGADFEHQKKELSAIVRELGFCHFIVDNDGFLGLKAGSPDGVGICSINGTGTVTVGINAHGERLQIGGLGPISSDKAGAGYIAERGVAAVYDFLFRCGKKTVLKDMLFETFGVKNDSEFALRASEAIYTKEGVLRINKLMEEAERLGDEPIREILSEIGRELALSVAGCAKRLNMRGEISVVLTGSVWAKGSFEAMRHAFARTLAESEDCTFICNILKQPPVAGAVVWAYEEYRKANPDLQGAFSHAEFLSGKAFKAVVY